MYPPLKATAVPGPLQGCANLVAQSVAAASLSARGSASARAGIVIVCRASPSRGADRRGLDSSSPGSTDRPRPDRGAPLAPSVQAPAGTLWKPGSGARRPRCSRRRRGRSRRRRHRSRPNRCPRRRMRAAGGRADRRRPSTAASTGRCFPPRPIPAPGDVRTADGSRRRRPSRRDPAEPAPSPARPPCPDDRCPAPPPLPARPSFPHPRQSRTPGMLASETQQTQEARRRAKERWDGSAQ